MEGDRQKLSKSAFLKKKTTTKKNSQNVAFSIKIIVLTSRSLVAFEKTDFKNSLDDVSYTILVVMTQV